MIRVGRFPYLNVAPFFWESERWGVTWVSGSPAALGRLAAEGAVDAGPLSIADTLRLEATFEPLGALGIASRGEARSVLLFSRRPVAELDGAVVGLTPESATSVLLLRLLLEERYRVRPRAYRPGREGDAWLLIGDAALRERSRTGAAPYVYDLGREWWAWQGAPFVFARWVVRRSLAVGEKARLRAGIEASLSVALGQLEQVGAAWAGAAGRSGEEIAAYLRGFTYRLGPEEARGLARFRARLATAERRWRREAVLRGERDGRQQAAVG